MLYNPLHILRFIRPKFYTFHSRSQISLFLSSPMPPLIPHSAHLHPRTLFLLLHRHVPRSSGTTSQSHRINRARRFSWKSASKQCRPSVAPGPPDAGIYNRGRAARGVHPRARTRPRAAAGGASAPPSCSGRVGSGSRGGLALPSTSPARARTRAVTRARNHERRRLSRVSLRAGGPAGPAPANRPLSRIEAGGAGAQGV